VSTPTSERDPVISDVLGSIRAPEHRPTFWADLHRRLDAEITIVPDDPGATVTPIAAGKLPAHAPGARRLDTGELPSVRTLTHERTRRRGRAPWLAIAAGIAVLAGAVGVVTLAGERAGDDAEVADGSTGDTAAPTEATGGESTGSTAAPTASTTISPTTVVTVAATPEAAVETWLAELAAGDAAAAATQLGPRTLGYLQTIGADPVGLMTESQEGYGAWPDATDAQVATIPLGSVPQLGTELAVVTISGTYPGEGAGPRVDALPVVLDSGAWRIESAAHQPDRDNRVIFTLPALGDDGTLGTMAPGDEINLFAPSPGVVFFVLDGGPPQSKPTTPIGRNGDPFALYNPPEDLAPGPHHVVVVAVGDDGTITSYAGTFTVEG
jgi:hypothetical protein